MKFGEMIKLLQEKEKGYIILINCGGFYIARGRDAILLNKILDLKLTCMEKDVCKIGFPINALGKYKKLIEKNRYSYIIYKFDNQNNKLEIIEKYNGEFKNTEKENKRDCVMCKMGNSGYTEKNEKYMEAIMNLYRGEMNERK